MTDWMVLVVFHDIALTSLPVDFDTEQEAVWYAEFIANEPHIRRVTVYKNHGVYKTTGDSE